MECVSSDGRGHRLGGDASGRGLVAELGLGLWRWPADASAPRPPPVTAPAPPRPLAPLLAHAATTHIAPPWPLPSPPLPPLPPPVGSASIAWPLDAHGEGAPPALERVEEGAVAADGAGWRLGVGLEPAGEEPLAEGAQAAHEGSCCLASLALWSLSDMCWGLGVGGGFAWPLCAMY